MKDNRLTLSERKRIQALGAGFSADICVVATESGLSEYVLNDECRVPVELEDSQLSVESFIHLLTQRVPPLARVDSLTADSFPL